MNTNSPVLSIKNLHFGYSYHHLILDRLNLEVPAASIYGFLGANGAGKSTTIRNILGLLKPHKGSIQLFGQELPANRMEILRNVGSLIESPSIYLHLSAYDNLQIACKYLELPKARIEEVLEIVNLSKPAKRISKQYSTGMKQRLGLAIALLTDPELLILDEPTNGLDPTGIIEIRNIIQELHQRGKTIFLSSHLLSEIEKIATQVGVLKQGRIIFQGTIAELEQLKRSKQKVKIVTPNVIQAMEILNEKLETYRLDQEVLEITLGVPHSLPEIIKNLVLKGIPIYEVSPQKSDLEKLFIDLTEN